MLSRTADSLYWTGRYLERADFLARILDASFRLDSIPAQEKGDAQVWAGALASAGAKGALGDRQPTERLVREYLAFSPDNPTSIHACLTRARHNARQVRTGLTLEVWEAINGAWNGLEEQGRPTRRDDFIGFLEWVKGVTLMVEGATSRTMMRNDGYWFLRLGAALERADNTARLVDVKYHLLLPEGEKVGGQFDYFQWTTLLREVSALSAYRWIYKDNVKPWLVADLMVLNRQMPRSLASCQAAMVEYLDRLASLYGRKGPAQRIALTRLNQFEGETMSRIFQSGLHEYILAFIAENNRLSQAIAEQYLT